MKNNRISQLFGPRGRQSGFVMIGILIAMTVVGLFAAVMFRLSTGTGSNAVSTASADQAFYSAESGARIAMHRITKGLISAGGETYKLASGATATATLESLEDGTLNMVVASNNGGSSEVHKYSFPAVESVPFVETNGEVITTRASGLRVKVLGSSIYSGNNEVPVTMKAQCVVPPDPDASTETKSQFQTRLKAEYKTKYGSTEKKKYKDNKKYDWEEHYNEDWQGLWDQIAAKQGSTVTLNLFEGKDVDGGEEWTFEAAKEGTKMTVYASSGYMSKWSNDNSGQIIALRNGDDVPHYAPMGNQPPIEEFLSSVVDENKKVRIAENEVLFLFELGTTQKYTSAFDMQDLVVLVTGTATTTTTTTTVGGDPNTGGGTGESGGVTIEVPNRVRSYRVVN